MALSSTSKICFLDCDGQPLDAPVEWTTALIELLIPVEEWESASLDLQNRELPLKLTKLAGACTPYPCRLATRKSGPLPIACEMV